MTEPKFLLIPAEGNLDEDEGMTRAEIIDMLQAELHREGKLELDGEPAEPFEDFGDDEIIQDLYDNYPALRAELAERIPNFEYPDWSHKTIGEVRRYLEKK